MTGPPGGWSNMPDTDHLPEDVLDPFETLDGGFDLLGAAAHAMTDVPDVATVAERVLALDRDDRFGSSAASVDVTARVDAAPAVTFLDDLARTVQRELFVGGLLADDPEDHMVLAAALQVARENLAGLEDAADRSDVWSAVLALGARLHRAAREGELTDEAVREVALAEYHGLAAAGEPVQDHPDTVAPLHVRADLRVYGAVLAYDSLGLSTEAGAALAAESESDFAEVLDAYGLEPPER